MSSTDTFDIKLQRGITGGFVPPIPDALYVISHSLNSDTFTVTTQIRPIGFPCLWPPNSKKFKVADHLNKLSNLLHILCDLPTQYPGARDLYGRDISIVLQTHPEDDVKMGSYAGSGVLDPTEQQKALFDEAVDIIEKLAAL